MIKRLLRKWLGVKDVVITDDLMRKIIDLSGSTAKDLIKEEVKRVVFSENIIEIAERVVLRAIDSTGPYNSKEPRLKRIVREVNKDMIHAKIHDHGTICLIVEQLRNVQLPKGD